LWLCGIFEMLWLKYVKLKWNLMEVLFYACVVTVSWYNGMLQYLRFSQCCSRRFQSCGTLYCFVGVIVVGLLDCVLQSFTLLETIILASALCCRRLQYLVIWFSKTTILLKYNMKQCHENNAEHFIFNSSDRA